MSCSSDRSVDLQRQDQEAMDAVKNVSHKILVMSGKGGVGKTTVSVNLASALTQMGFRCGILDVDLHGPDVALMMGVEGYRATGGEGTLDPIEAAGGVRVLSVSSFLPDSSVPIAWRGPRKSAMIRNLLSLGDWSEMDVLVIDCPPGTGDEPMTVGQLVPDADGAVVVTTPQDVALLDSRKCVRFVQDLGLPVLGIVENLSGFTCPKCGQSIDLFKAGGGEAAAAELKVPFLGRVPISGKMVPAGDAGTPIVLEDEEDSSARALIEIAGALADGWK